MIAIFLFCVSGFDEVASFHRDPTKAKNPPISYYSEYKCEPLLQTL